VNKEETAFLQDAMTPGAAGTGDIAAHEYKDDDFPALGQTKGNCLHGFVAYVDCFARCLLWSRTILGHLDVY
jgi:hypothetical protein